MDLNSYRLIIRHSVAIALFLSICFWAAGGLQASEQKAADGLPPVLMEYRTLIIFTPSVDDLRFREQQSLLYREIDGLLERHMAVVVVANAQSAHSELGPDTDLQNDDIRKIYDVAEETFTVILIGEDGQEKFRSMVTVPAPVLFALIDRMPTRQQELSRARRL